jgi:hypothetical protein
MAPNSKVREYKVAIYDKCSFEIPQESIPIY